MTTLGPKAHRAVVLLARYVAAHGGAAMDARLLAEVILNSLGADDLELVRQIGGGATGTTGARHRTDDVLPELQKFMRDWRATPQAVDESSR